MLLEICVDSLASARAAIAGGADRLELCSALLAGGLTPYEGLLRQIRAESDIPIRCLMRPRPGDFLYTPEERELMRLQILQLKNADADGFVIGCLTAQGDLDVEAMAPLVEACSGCGITLHRCIDVSREPLETCRQAGAMGIDTVLTSGAAASCTQGQELIARMIAMNGPEILIGAGVNAQVIRHFRQAVPGAAAFHMSGKTQVESRMRFRREGVPMGLPGLDEWHIQQTSQEAISAARKALDA